MYQIDRLVSFGSQIAASLTTYYTCPAGTRTRITSCTVTNNTGGNQTYSLHLVPSGGTADATNRIINTNTVVAAKNDSGTYAVVGQVLRPGDTIQAIASAATSISLFIAGIETT